MQRRCGTLITLIEREVMEMEDKGKQQQRGAGASAATPASLSGVGGAAPNASLGQKRKSSSTLNSTPMEKKVKV